MIYIISDKQTTIDDGNYFMDCVFFGNGIGNFILATPFLQNLNNPIIFIEKTDPRLDAIKSISKFNIIELDTDKELSGYRRKFVLWGFDHSNFRQATNGAVVQPKPDFKSGLYEKDSYLQLLSDFKNYPTSIKIDPAWKMYHKSIEPLICIANGCNAKWAAKKYPLNLLEKLLELLVSKLNARIVLVGDKIDEHFFKPLKSNDQIKNHIWDFSGKFPLAKTADIIRQCNLMISNDTCLLHISDAVGIKSIGLFGPTFWTKNSPVNGNCTLIQSSSGGCEHFKCLHSKHLYACPNNVCIQTITIDSIFEAARGLL